LCGLPIRLNQLKDQFYGHKKIKEKRKDIKMASCCIVN
jgi:hypothetical protein